MDSDTHGITGCTCPLAGFCERHSVVKPARWHQLCRTRQAYFDQWEQGNGPGQNGAVYREYKEPKRKRFWLTIIQRLRTPEDKGVGDTVERIISKVGGRRFKSWSRRIGMPCNCGKRQDDWNRLYPYW